MSGTPGAENPLVGASRLDVNHGLDGCGLHAKSLGHLGEVLFRERQYGVGEDFR